MTIVEPTLAHLAFANALAELADDTSEDWHRLTAGWLTLRLVTAHEAAGRSSLAAEHFDATRRGIVALRAGDSMRALLGSIVTAVERSEAGDYTTVRPRLLAYGRLLEFEGRWELGAEVYRATLGLCRDTGEWADASAASLRLGECYRYLSRWDDAHSAFAASAAHAMMGGDIARALRARILSASVSAERGSVSAAEAELCAIEREATAGGLPESAGLARHGRAHVAFLRGDHAAAARHAFAALDHLVDPMARDRALADVAAAFAELGVLSAARDAHLIVAATTQEPFVRWTALVNLMELAARDRREPVFEQYRRELANEALPPRLAGYYHLYAARGAWAFGRIEIARSELARAQQVARAAKLLPLLAEADAAMEQLESEAPRANSAVPPPRGTRAIAMALSRMRTELALAS